MNKSETIIKELTCLLMFLTNWEEDSKKDPEEKILKTWTGYRFNTLNALEAEKLIVQRGPRLVQLTPEGIEEAKKLKEKYFNGAENV